MSAIWQLPFQRFGKCQPRGTLISPWIVDEMVFRIQSGRPQFDAGSGSVCKGHPKWLGNGILLKLGIAIVAAWIVALIAVAAGMPLSAVLVLALIISAGVFRILKKPETPR